MRVRYGEVISHVGMQAGLGCYTDSLWNEFAIALKFKVLSLAS